MLNAPAIVSASHSLPYQGPAVTRPPLTPKQQKIVLGIIVVLGAALIMASVALCLPQVSLLSWKASLGISLSVGVGLCLTIYIYCAKREEPRREQPIMPFIPPGALAASADAIPVAPAARFLPQLNPTPLPPASRAVVHSSSQAISVSSPRAAFKQLLATGQAYFVLIAPYLSLKDRVFLILLSCSNTRECVRKGIEEGTRAEIRHTKSITGQRLLGFECTLHMYRLGDHAKTQLSLGAKYNFFLDPLNLFLVAQHFTALQELTISAHFLMQLGITLEHEDGRDPFSEGFPLEKRKSITFLKVVDPSDIYSSYPGQAQGVASGIARMMCALPGLTALSLCDMPVVVSNAINTDSLTYLEYRGWNRNPHFYGLCRRVRYLWLSNQRHPLSQADVNSIGENLPELESLRVTGIGDIEEFVPLACCSRLTSLNLGSAPSDLLPLNPLFSRLPALRFLSIRLPVSDFLDSEKARSFADSLGRCSRNLTYLNVGNLDFNNIFPFINNLPHLVAFIREEARNKLHKFPGRPLLSPDALRSLKEINELTTIPSLKEA